MVFQHVRSVLGLDTYSLFDLMSDITMDTGASLMEFEFNVFLSKNKS